MTGENFWSNALAQEVVSICKEQNLREADCEPLVRVWIKDISPKSRPTVSGVNATAQRKIWNLEPTPF